MNKFAAVSLIALMLASSVVYADDCKPIQLLPKVHHNHAKPKPVIPGAHKVVHHTIKKVKATDCNKDTLVPPPAPVGCYCSAEMLGAINDGDMAHIDEMLKDEATHGHNVACLVDRAAYYMATDKTKAYDLYMKVGPHTDELVSSGCNNSMSSVSVVLTQMEKDTSNPGNPDIQTTVIIPLLPPSTPHINYPSPE